MSIRISIVVPTCRRPESLARCLTALTGQDMDRRQYEIIVVDDGRGEETRAQVAEFSRRQGDAPTVRYLQPPAGTRGPAAARNAGWRTARGEIIAFTDDDTVPGRSWLSEGVKAMPDGIAAAWGRVIVPLRPNPTDAERNTAGLDKAEFITANCFVRRDALELVGGFDERFTRPWREDSDLYFTLLEYELPVVSVPTATVIHPAHTAPPINCLRQHRNLYFDALLYKKHPGLYRQKIAAAPPLRYYATVASFLFGLIALLAGAPIAAGIGAAGWLGLSGKLAWDRTRGITTDRRERLGVVLTSFAIPFLAVYWRLAGAWHFRVAFV